MEMYITLCYIVVSDVHSAKPKHHRGDGDKKEEDGEDSSLGSVTQDSEENSETDRKKVKKWC